MGKKPSNTIKYLLSAALMVALLYFAFRNVGWSSFTEEIRSTNFSFVLFSMAFGFTAFIFRALRWKLLLQPLDPGIGFIRTFSGVCIGNLANCALPFAGEIVRCGIVSTDKAGWDKTIGTIALERLWDLISIVLIVVLALILKGEAVCSFVSENIITPIIGRAAEIRWIAPVIALIVVGIIISVVRLRERSRFLNRMYGFLDGLRQGFVSFIEMNGKGIFLLLTLLIWSSYWMMCVCISSGFPPASGLSVSDTLFIMAVGNLASVIPVPGGFGAYHYIVALALSGIYGLSWSNGIVFATLSHESQAIVMIVSGLICYISRTLAMRKK